MMTELESRTARLTRQAEDTGSELAIRFQFEGAADLDRKMPAVDSMMSTTATIDVPEGCFVNMLRYISGNELIHTVSLVCKAWLSASRLPIVYEDGVDMSRLNMDMETKLMTMTSFVKLLARPQFATLKGLALPYNLKIGKNSLKSIAKVVPDLEALDLGYFHADSYWAAKASINDSELNSLTDLFTNLTTLHIDMANVTSAGIEVVVRKIGEQLVELKVHTDNLNMGGNYISEQAMETISTSCPNLKNFSYRTGSGIEKGRKNVQADRYDSRAAVLDDHYNSSLDGVTGDNVISLVMRCPKLHNLTLYGAQNVKESHFVQIANLVASNLDKFSLRQISVSGYSDFDIKTSLAGYAFLDVEDKFVRPRLGKGIVFWSKRKGDDRMYMPGGYWRTSLSHWRSW